MFQDNEWGATWGHPSAAGDRRGMKGVAWPSPREARAPITCSGRRVRVGLGRPRCDPRQGTRDRRLRPRFRDRYRSADRGCADRHRERRHLLALRRAGEPPRPAADRGRRTPRATRWRQEPREEGREGRREREADVTDGYRYVYGVVASG